MPMRFIHKVSLSLIGLFLLFLTGPVWAEPIEEDYDNMMFVYIDNSKLNVNDGLTSSQIKQLIALNDSLINSKSCKYFLFASNDYYPFISSDPAGSSEYIKKLYSSQTSFPNINSDMQKIRESLFHTPFKIEKRLDLCFFITDNLCSSNNYEISKLFCSLSREISMMTDFTGITHVTIYYSNQTKSVTADNIEKNTCFYNSKGEMKPKIFFELVKLQ
jgi:hypothetical protein